MLRVKVKFKNRAPFVSPRLKNYTKIMILEKKKKKLGKAKTEKERGSIK